MLAPSIVLISIDSLRYDCVSYQRHQPHLTAAGIGRRPRTPHLDRLCERSFAFTQAVATAPYTTTSHASLFTGRVPPDHGVRSFLSAGLADDVPTLAEQLGALGYRSMLVSDTSWLFRAVQLDRGFDAVGENFADARRWWDDCAGHPRLLVLHFMEMHEPYGFRKPAAGLSQGELVRRNTAWLEQLRESLAPALRGGPAEPPPQQPRQLMRCARELHRHVVSGRDGNHWGLRWYLNALERMDAGTLSWLVDWFDEAGIFDSAIVALFGDHGEGWDRTSTYKLGHCCLMYDDVIRVPLTIRLPGGAGRVCDDPCSLVDVAPTLLELIGAPHDLEEEDGPFALVNGRSLGRVLQGGPRELRPAYGEFWQRWSGRQNGQIIETLRQRMLRWPDRKFSLIGRETAYDTELRSLDSREFVMRLCVDLCGQAADDERRWQRVMRWVDRAGSLGRRALYWLFDWRAHHGPMPKAAEFDLAVDPLEMRPTCHRGESSGRWSEVLNLFEALDAAARPGSPLRGKRREIFAVERRLRELGYVE